jgi:hypothetical protein
MAEAVFRHGDPVHMDYTPSAGNVAAGEVVLLGNTAGLTCGIAHLDITNNALGALAVGGGIYDVTMITNIAAYTKVYWDDACWKAARARTPSWSACTSPTPEHPFESSPFPFGV